MVQLYLGQRRSTVRGLTEVADLPRLLAGAGPILLDFDGPVCSIFAGYPAPVITAELRSLLVDAGVKLPSAVSSEEDPLEILRWTAKIARPDLMEVVEDALCSAELEATSRAQPTPFAREAVVAASRAGHQLAIVSNNSTAAINAYLADHGLDNYVAYVAGRARGVPERMKPDPQSIRSTVLALGTEPQRCVLVGDSLSDILGSKAAGVPVIGYANKPAKVEQFERAKADAIVTTMADIAAALLDATPNRTGD